MTQPDAPHPKTTDELGAALTDRERLFVASYFELNLNATAAARVCGYKLPRQEGHRVRHRPHVDAYIRARMGEYMPAEEVLQRLTALARTDGSQFLKEEEYEVPVFEPRPLQERIDHLAAQVGRMQQIDPELLKSRIEKTQAEIADLEVKLAMDPEATYQKQVGTEMRTRIVPSLEAAQENGVLFAIESAEYTQHGLKFKRQDPVKALELIGKHHKLFADRQVLENPDGSAVKFIAGLSEDDL
ncbi:terminase small subunit [Deinococcus navajonensis]|uniref:Terminase small subunit n=1 Tax=Deinococcus navajonensis TaxID=309884 RepID=A0ABV8XR64_9DEIO